MSLLLPPPPLLLEPPPKRLVNPPDKVFPNASPKLLSTSIQKSNVNIFSKILLITSANADTISPNISGIAETTAFTVYRMISGSFGTNAFIIANIILINEPISFGNIFIMASVVCSIDSTKEFIKSSFSKAFVIASINARIIFNNDSVSFGNNLFALAKLSARKFAKSSMCASNKSAIFARLSATKFSKAFCICKITPNNVAKPSSLSQASKPSNAPPNKSVNKLNKSVVISGRLSPIVLIIE